jgi:two-component system chemotaxis response regulator CheB
MFARAWRATAVHRFGGTVIASTADTATHAAMPRATVDRHHAANHVVALDDIPAVMIALTTARIITETDTQQS